MKKLRNTEAELKKSITYKKKACIAKFTGKHLYRNLFFNEVVGSYNKKRLHSKKTPAQVFSCELCKIFKSNFLQNISDDYFWCNIAAKYRQMF